MTIFRKITISILLIGLCAIFGIASCTRENTGSTDAGSSSEATGQSIGNEAIYTDFTTSYDSEVSQIGDFVVRDEILVLYTGSARHVEIPADLKIKGIGQAFSHSSVVSIVIPEQVETVEGLYGARAFDGCYYLQSITVDPNNKHYISVDGVLFNKAMTELVHFPQAKSGSYTVPVSITAIDRRTFSNRRELSSITIPANVTRIEDYAFNGCSGLTSITVDRNNTNYASVDGVLFNKALTDLIWFPHGKTGSYTMPNSVTRIRQDAFTSRWELTSVVISNSVTRIEDNTFSGCGKLGTVTIPASVTFIGNSVFSGCSSLSAISIPSSVLNIGETAFTGCTNLALIIVDDNNTQYASIDGVLFDKAISELIYFPLGKGGSYSIPNSITRIKEFAFSDRTSLNSVNIPASVTSIGENAFFGCTRLSSISVDANNANYASIDGVLFNKAITELIRFPRAKTGRYTIPNTVVTISQNAFAGASGLNAITIPNSVTTIGDTAFARTGLTSLTIPNSVTKIGSGAFADNPNLTIIGLPDNYMSYENGKGGEYFYYGCTGLRQIIASSNNKFYTTVDGVLFNKDKTELIRFPQGKTGLYIIPSTVTTISYKAFYGSSGLTTVIIPASVTNIGDFAFDGCTNLASVVISNGVVEIGKYAFARCTSLASVNIPASVASIGDFAFYDTSLRQITVDSNNQNFILANGMLFKRDMMELHRYLAAALVE